MPLGGENGLIRLGYERNIVRMTWPMALEIGLLAFAAIAVWITFKGR